GAAETTTGATEATAGAAEGPAGAVFLVGLGLRDEFVLVRGAHELMADVPGADVTAAGGLEGDVQRTVSGLDLRHPRPVGNAGVDLHLDAGGDAGIVVVRPDRAELDRLHHVVGGAALAGRGLEDLRALDGGAIGAGVPRLLVRRDVDRVA